MANTRETMGEQACLDALVAGTLTSFEDDAVTRLCSMSLGAGSSYNLSPLTSLTLSSCHSFMGQYAASNLKQLETIDMLGGGSIASYSMYGDEKLKALVLRSSTKTTLASTYVLDGSGIEYGTGAVYVPDAMVATYRADSKWSKYIVLPLSRYPSADISTVTDTWAQIAAASLDGTYASKYTVGDVKSMEIDGRTYYFQLVAKDADELASDSTKTAPMTWLMRKCLLNGSHNMKSASGGYANLSWADSDLRAWLTSDVLPLFPSDVRSAIKEVRKYSDVYSNDTFTHDGETVDKLWVPSANEVFSASVFETKGPKYPELTSGLKCYYSNNYSYYYWTRSAYNSTNANRKMVVVESGGASGQYDPYSSIYIRLGFCI